MKKNIRPTIEFFTHPQALCDSANVGAGTRIWAFSHVMEKAVIGEECNIGENVYIENGVRLGNNVTVKNGVCLWDHVTLEDDVFIGPCAVFTNDFTPRSFIKKRHDSLLRPTLVQKGATIGANATLLCGIRIGEFALVGAGAVVTRDVPPHALVVGNPARIVARVCYCGTTLDSNEFCRVCDLPLNKNNPAHAAVCATRVEDNTVG